MSSFFLKSKRKRKTIHSWLKVLKALGAAKVFLYSLDVHPNVRRVVEHYTSRGEVELITLSLPEHQPNLPGLQHLYIRKHLDSKRQNELGQSASSSTKKNRICYLLLLRFKNK